METQMTQLIILSGLAFSFVCTSEVSLQMKQLPHVKLYRQLQLLHRATHTCCWDSDWEGLNYIAAKCVR